MQQTLSQAKRPFNLWRSGTLPILALGSLSGLVGVYWDISWHIDMGRDSFFSPPHTFIYASMLIALLISIYGLIRDRRHSALHLSFANTSLHPGLLIVAFGAALELFFAPADDLWHRQFGADLSLWAPMHLIGVSGLILFTFGALISSWIERRLSLDSNSKKFYGLCSLFFAAVLLGWLMLLLSEYEFGVPAFPVFWHPLLVTALPVFPLLMMAKLRPVPFAATLTALIFTLMRFLLAGWLTMTASLDLAGITQPVIPILITTALAADLLIKRKLPLWLLSLILGLVGFVSNWLLSFAIPIYFWHSAALIIAVPSGLILAIVMGYAANATATALQPKLSQS